MKGFLMNDSAYWDLHQRAVKALYDAKLTEAEATFLAARQEAKDQRLSILADRAHCNWAATRTVRGKTAGLSEGLSRILGRSVDPTARQLASYNLALILRLQGSSRPARFYSEMALRLAESLRDRSKQASSLHHLGLLEMHDGRLDDAGKSLRKSLELSTGVGEYRHSLMTMSTLGYCLSLKGALTESLWMLEEAEAALTTLGWKVYEPAVRLNLGYSFLEMGDLEESIEQGRAALKSMEGQGIEEERFAYYLLGEAHAQKEDQAGAKEYFNVLEKTFYPNYSGLAETLLKLRTSRWINWLGQ
jgi:tetratricopeptide (TPR) repeat protein